MFVIVIISLYLIVFYTYFAALDENNLFKLLFAWLPVLVIRISHYADHETGSKIGKAIANYIFPIWLILLAYHINNLEDNIFTLVNKNPDVFYFFIAAVAVTYFFEIIMSKKNESIVSYGISNNKNKQERILAQYTEILYSADK